uniref:Uncharacterized protein n=1 Tax=Scleropages formosus TaxID=113540 RepID=A0A8C9WQG9_SCLFO
MPARIGPCPRGWTLLLLWVYTLLILSFCPQLQAKRRAIARGGMSRGFGGGPGAGAAPIQSRGYAGGVAAGAPPVQSRGYGGGFGPGAPPVHSQGYGGGYGPGAPPVHSQGSSSSGLKVAGAAAAGALGGAILGHGLSSLAHPGYGYGGYGYNGYGRYGGLGNGYRSGSIEDTGLLNETDAEFYIFDSSSRPVASSCIILGSLVSFLLAHFVPSSD